MSPDELKELERRPGATPALAQRELPPAAPVAGLAGAPGPSPIAGPDDALVKLVVFSDFQCPVCRRAAEPVKQLLREFGGDLQVIWKHNALTAHANAEGAAIAAVAAQRQGKFWEFHDLLFENNARLGASDLEGYAARLGLDLERFKKDLADPTVKAQVDYERSLAESLEARGTPSFFVNGMKNVGWGSYVGIRSQVRRALEKAQAKVAAGTPRAEVAALEAAAMGDEGKRLAAAVFGTK
jgi:protein-disulfide isomerase